MIAKRILLTLIIAAVVVSQATVAGAQSEQGSRRAKGGWSAIAKGGSAEMTLQRRDSAHKETMETQAFEPRADVDKLRLVGTWVMNIPDSSGSPGFNALVTAEDVRLTDSVQRGLGAGLPEQGRFLLNSERLIAHFQKLVLGAIA